MNIKNFTGVILVLALCVAGISVSASPADNPRIPKTSLTITDAHLKIPKTETHIAIPRSPLIGHSDPIFLPGNSDSGTRRSNPAEFIEVKIIGMRNAEIFLDNVPGFGQLLGRTDENGILVCHVPAGVHTLYGFAGIKNYQSYFQFIGVAQYNFSTSQYQYTLAFYPGSFFLPEQAVQET